MLNCTQTNKKIEKCCCKRNGDKLYCTLAKRTLEKCCCEPDSNPKEKANL